MCPHPAYLVQIDCTRHWQGVTFWTDFGYNEGNVWRGKWMWLDVAKRPFSFNTPFTTHPRPHLAKVRNP